MNAGPIAHPLRLAPASLLALHAAFPQRYPALLESAAASATLGRYDILFAFPEAELVLDVDGSVHTDGPIAASKGFLGTLDAWWSHERRPTPTDWRLPFQGGWLVFLGYELATFIESRLELPLPRQGPIAQAIRIPMAIIVEHASDSAWIIAEAHAQDRIAQVQSDLAALDASAVPPGSLIQGDVVEEEPHRFTHAVARALDYIGAGDIYQANLSRAWRARLAEGVQPHHIYARLRQTNPAPFCALAQLDELAIVSSSPERLIEIRDGWASTRPIAGTRPRANDRSRDHDLARELHAHPKERAEHVMLIDLERNDLGRICAAGTVEVNELMVLESYAHVHHIVSNVRGRLRADVTPGRALGAVFPGGTITGCPKIRCMQIIAQLEGEPRGAYTGSLGYLNRDGSLDMNILIRSLEVRGSALTLRAGAGIVADSVPERELEETRAKARGVLRALTQEREP